MKLVAFAVLFSCVAGFAQTDSEPEYRIGNGVTAPTVLRRVDPAYPESATQVHEGDGTVTLSVLVGSDGHAQDVKVLTTYAASRTRKKKGQIQPPPARALQCSDDFDASAVAAVRKWLFKPGLKDGVPVNVRSTIYVNFRLQ